MSREEGAALENYIETTTKRLKVICVNGYRVLYKHGSLHSRGHYYSANM